MAFWNRKPKAPPKLRELEPHPGLASGTAQELLRAWIVGERLHVVARPAAMRHAAWGIALADLLRHVARAWSQSRGMPEDAFEGDLHAAFVQHAAGSAGVGEDRRLTVVPPGTGALPCPASAAEDPHSSEVLRLVQSTDASFAIRWDVFGAPEPWGYVAADLACFLARGFARGGGDEARALAEIRSLFDAEWRSPSSPVEGEIEGDGGVAPGSAAPAS